MESSETFESELTQLLPRLRRFAHSLSRNGADADDLTQATIERALRSREQWQPGTRLDSWLYRIMRNLWIDTARARTRRERHEAPEGEAQSVGEDPRESIEASLELKRAMAAMERLPDEQSRQALRRPGWGRGHRCRLTARPGAGYGPVRRLPY